MPKNPKSPAPESVPPSVVHYMTHVGPNLVFYKRTGPMAFAEIGRANLGEANAAEVYESARKKKLRFFIN